ncbi:NAD dependent epimerase/dehydratase family protein [Lentithecium fluviatile CBS 122367]|uniref:NAD dependent epimerase/dehydratase family protein n=1 Tax=Lentithecium fluviatile CBS 122367 TaxID=1168545 RepID=A0A6G1IMD6_9PLEO|nr:NAD dependent epimerase/dehydratase family protein [Lentithecium fluviatile CBS 122367]
MPSAIVTGATGILGRQIVFELSRHAPQWPTVHALSRSKKEDYPDNVIHNHVDLTSSADDMASKMQNVRGDYIFFAAYLAKDSEKEAWDVNGAMLENFLTALTKTGAIADVKRIILVTGAKQYGVHLGVPKNPMLEDDPWLSGEEWPPNFYYNQQNILHKFCKEHGKEWVVTYPNDVIGFANGNFMNLSLALALYATITKELGQDLVFPGSPTFYTKFDCFTSTKLHAEFCAWAALEPRAANQAFNVVNGDTESWQNLWPKVAKYFGLRVKPDQFAPDTKGYATQAASRLRLSSTPAPLESSSVTLHEHPPISALAPQLGLRDHTLTQPSKVEQQIDLVKWAQRGEVREAWRRVAEREGLQEDVFEKATWGFLGFVLGRAFDLVIGMSKARKAGWVGYEDTWECLEGVFGELGERGLVPRVK